MPTHACFEDQAYVHAGSLFVLVFFRVCTGSSENNSVSPERFLPPFCLRIYSRGLNLLSFLLGGSLVSMFPSFTWSDTSRWSFLSFCLFVSFLFLTYAFFGVFYFLYIILFFLFCFYFLILFFFLTSLLWFLVFLIFSVWS